MGIGFLTGSAPAWAEIAMPLTSVLVLVLYYAYQAWIDSQADSSTPASQLTLNTLMQRVRSAWVNKNYNGGSEAVNVSFLPTNPQRFRFNSKLSIRGLIADVSRLHPLKCLLWLLSVCRLLRLAHHHPWQLSFML